MTTHLPDDDDADEEPLDEAVEDEKNELGDEADEVEPLKNDDIPELEPVDDEPELLNNCPPTIFLPPSLPNDIKSAKYATTTITKTVITVGLIK